MPSSARLSGDNDAWDINAGTATNDSTPARLSANKATSVTLDQQTDHRPPPLPSALDLPSDHLSLGVTPHQAQVDDRPSEWVSGEEGGHLEGITAVGFHADGQRLQAVKASPGSSQRERGHCPGGLLHKSQSIG
ncbi:hypothetical protein TYRP_017270 [Tyrophagus putrescentiae]|nr:hypothetical protein TYRP_017270 [Tyrophagus putrescentiae]